MYLYGDTPTAPLCPGRPDTYRYFHSYDSFVLLMSNEIVIFLLFSTPMSLFVPGRSPTERLRPEPSFPFSSVLSEYPPVLLLSHRNLTQSMYPTGRVCGRKEDGGEWERRMVPVLRGRTTSIKF